MPKEEWGTKRLCPVSGKRFYDMNRSPIISPYTGEVVTLDTGKQSRVVLADKAEKKDVVELAEDTDEVIEVEDDADVDLDDDILEDDDDDDNVSLDEIADVATNDDD